MTGSAYKIIFTGFTALVSGVAIGVLLAPGCGRDTRQKVMDTAENIRKRIMGFAARSGHTVEDVKQMLTDEVEGLNPALRTRLLQLIESAERKIS
ncbi:MAG TPA: YtxH domain-containing protein [Chitinophagaceae bacterium]